MITEDEFREKASSRRQEAQAFLSPWQRVARTDYDFCSGKQWEAEDETLLEQQNRPIITFNYSEKMIDAVAGAEVSNRQEVRYVPREITDSSVADLWTEAGRWARDQCNAADEETDSFRDCLICGIGATRTAMDYEEEADGMIVMHRRDPLTLLYDPAARKPGLVDRRYDFEYGWMDEEEAKLRWPKMELWGGQSQDDGFSGVIQTGNRYREDVDSSADIHKGQVEIMLYECVEKEAYYKIADGQQMLEMSAEEFAPLRSAIDKVGLKYVKLFKRVYYRAFMSGDSILEWGKSPCQHGFTLNFMTGKRDRNRNFWYGLTRVMKDPQRWANKWLSQILHIINSNAKGGILAEVGAFVDPKAAQDEWANPDSVTLLNEGAISGQKVQQKNMAGYPSGLDRLMEFALNSLPQVTGINLEALGLANRDQANVLEQSRKQAAYGLLAPIFDALRRYRKEQGKVMLYFITEYISDGRLIRIVGPDGAKAIPLTKTPGAITYDIVVDQAPNSPDQKQKTWEQLMQIVPVMMKEGLPVPPDLLNYTPLPAALVDKWKAYIQQVGGMSPQQMQQMQQQVQQLSQENQSLKQDQSVKMGELQMKREVAQADNMLATQKAAADMALEKFKVESELAIEQMRMRGEMALNEQKLGHDAKMQSQKIQGDLKIKAASAGITPNDAGDLSLKLDATEISGAMQAIAESNAQLGKMIQQISENNAKALAELERALNKPKKVMRDSSGRPIGVKSVDKLSGD